MNPATVGITLGILLFVFAFVPNEIKTKDSLPIRTEGIKIVLVFVAVIFWVNTFW